MNRKMKKFEHKIVMLDNDKLWTDIGLQGKGIFGGKECDMAPLPFANQLGDEGWEMVSVVQYSLSTAYFFKREIQ